MVFEWDDYYLCYYEFRKLWFLCFILKEVEVGFIEIREDKGYGLRFCEYSLKERRFFLFSGGICFSCVVWDGKCYIKNLCFLFNIN